MFRLGDYGAKKLAEVLASNQNVQGLNLEYSGLTFEGAKAIFEIFKTNSVIHTLNLGGNLLNNPNDQSYPKALGELFSQNFPALIRVSFAGTLLGAEGAKTLIAGLLQNRTITSLDLSGNNLMAEGCAAICDCLSEMKDECNIESLNLWGNAIGTEGAKSVARLIQSNKKLQKLNLKGKW
jgi:Ran GTPase-activating protein (RanGAP) involved in mRNA processing and transport